MIVQDVMYRCTVCGYRTSQKIEFCPACGEDRGPFWQSPTIWPHGRVSVFSESNPQPNPSDKGNTP